jgi:type IX secretion system PorP/SprF family membrane protein
MKQIFTYSILLVCFVTSVEVYGQQDPQFTQWMFDKLSFNPAYAGSQDENCLNFFYRDQWDQLNRDPKTVMLNYHQYVDPIKGGIGVTFYNDRVGQEVNNIFRLSYAYKYKFISGDVLSAGLALGYYGRQLGSDWRPPQTLPGDDPAINTSNQTSGSFDLNFGLYYEKPQKFYVGASLTHLTGQDLDELNMELAQHYYFMAGGQLPLSGDLTLKPNALFKGDFSTMTFDLNAIVDWNNTLYAGISYRLQDAIAPMAGYNHQLPTRRVPGSNNVLSQSLRIGYSYDATTSELKNYSTGSHELMLSYCFNIDLVPIRQPYGNPRFL